VWLLGGSGQSGMGCLGWWDHPGSSIQRLVTWINVGCVCVCVCVDGLVRVTSIRACFQSLYVPPTALLTLYAGICKHPGLVLACVGACKGGVLIVSGEHEYVEHHAGGSYIAITCVCSSSIMPG